MQRYSASSLLAGAVLSAFLAYTVIDLLLRKFSDNITFIDLGVIFILGLITGVAATLSYVFWRKRTNAS